MKKKTSVETRRPFSFLHTTSFYSFTEMGISPLNGNRAPSLGVEKYIMEFSETLLEEARKAAEVEAMAQDSSESGPVEETTPASTATPAEPADEGNANNDNGGEEQKPADNGVPQAGNEPKGTEPDGKQAGQRDDKNNNNDRRKPLTRLEKAEFSAAKWKRKAKELQAQRDAAVEEFNKYKDLNPRDFRNEEDRADFLAWRASQRQRISDFDENIENMFAEHDREVYESKIAECYNEEGSQVFAQLDDHYGDAFKAYCNNVDPDNVILDFLKDSKYEPAIRHIIYEDGDIQQMLLGREYNNAHIAAAERLALLKNLERQVAQFYANANRPQPPKAPNAQGAQQVSRPPEPPRQTRNNNPGVATQQAPARPRFSLPPRQPVAPQAAPAPQQAPVPPQQPVPQPAPQPRKVPQVTGALTRGNVGNGSVDPSVGADSLYSRLFQNN